MEYTVPQSSIMCMLIACLGSFIIPIALFLLLYKKGAGVKPFITGAAVFMMFVIGLEGAAVRAILGSSIGPVIEGNIWYYALFGGLMAGLFEEIGRFTAFRTVLRSDNGKSVNALMYGAGHGGAEAMIIIGSAMISNIMIANMVNKGNMDAITQGLSGEQLATLQAQIEQLATIPAITFILSLVERISAILLHMSLSVVVWIAAKRSTPMLLVAIVIHAAVDGATLLLSHSGINTFKMEAVIMVMALAAAFYAWVIWRKYEEKSEQ